SPASTAATSRMNGGQTTMSTPRIPDSRSASASGSGPSYIFQFPAMSTRRCYSGERDQEERGRAGLRQRDDRVDQGHRRRSERLLGVAGGMRPLGRRYGEPGDAAVGRPGLPRPYGLEGMAATPG